MIPLSDASPRVLNFPIVIVLRQGGGGDCFIHKGDLVNPGKPVVDYLAG
jgi:hypothetical protein